MAICKIINAKTKYSDDNALESVIRYISNPNKIRSGYFSGVAVDMNDPAKDMKLLSNSFKKYSRIRLRHFVVAFENGEVTIPEIADAIGSEVAECIGRKYQVVYAVHEDADHLHIHFVHNAVSYRDGCRYRGAKKEYYALHYTLQKILRPYGVRRIYMEH